MADVQGQIDRDALLKMKQIARNSGNQSQSLVEDIRAGRWDAVLEPLLSSIDDHGLACDLLELLMKSLVASGSHEAAKVIFTKVPVISVVLYKHEHDRFENIRRILDGVLPPFRDVKEEEQDRLALAARVDVFLKQEHVKSTEIQMYDQWPLEPSRLMILLQDALKWRRLTGTKGHEWDLGIADKESAPSKKQKQGSGEDNYRISLTKPKAVAAKFGKGVKLQSCCMSPDGKTFAVGTSDGFVELLHAESLKKRNDLSYQANDEPLFLDSPVTCLVFSLSSELIACGDTSGGVRIFSVTTGALVKLISTGHASGVSCLAISPDESKVATGGVDAVLRVFGLKSGSRLCECIGHESFVNSISYVSTTRLLSASSDEKCVLWNANTGEQVRSFTGFQGKVIRAVPFQMNCDKDGPPCTNRPGEMSHALVSSASRLSIISLDSSSAVSVIASRSSQDIVDAVLSRSGQYVFCWFSDGNLVQLDVQTKSQVTGDKISLGSKVDAQSPVALCADPSSEIQILAMWSNGVAHFSS